MALGYCQCLLKCLCITVPPHVFRHHVFPPPRIPSPHISPTTYSVTTYFLHHVSRSSPCDHDDDCDRRAAAGTIRPAFGAPPTPTVLLLLFIWHAP